MQEKADTLGDVIKNARMEADITMEALAERIGVTERYLYRIENEGKKPSYDVLKKLIRELAIQPDLIFYPEKPFQDSEAENLIRKLSSPGISASVLPLSHFIRSWPASSTISTLPSVPGSTGA